MYDAIVIGSRCAGAPTAMLLARRGRRVLVVDRASPPSDVLSGHTIQPAGMAYLARWGLLERVRATGVPMVSDSPVRLRRRRPRGLAGARSTGSTPPCASDARSSIRCSTDAAAEAGAEIRHGITVTELLRDGDRVVGIRGHDGAGRPVEERASIVVGADGVNSIVARSVGRGAVPRAPGHHVRRLLVLAGSRTRPASSSTPGPAGSSSPRRPTTGSRSWPQQVPVADAPRYRRRTAGAFAETLAEVPRLAARVAAAERVERFRCARLHDSFFRQPAGPGWALVGDAGYHKDPITAQGMLDAFRDAELLARAIDDGLDGDLGAMRRYQQDATPRPSRCTS